MTRESLERHQVWLYLCSILAGLALGSAAPALAPVMETLLWPSLSLLLYVTFTQVPLNALPAAFRDTAFLAAAVLGNFLVLPLLVLALLVLVPDDPAIRLGLALVLLVPCTDWFITFAHQAGGDLRRAITLTPVVLVLQMLLLPLYLWAFVGADVVQTVSATHLLTVSVAVIALPLTLAWLTERWAVRQRQRAQLIQRLGALPVPALAVVLALIAGAQVQTVIDALPVLGSVALACVGFLLGATLCGIVLAKAFGLPVPAARTLVFSLTTRNSFVVLPIALALPSAWEVAAIVIVFQSLIELLGMLVLLWLVPRKLLPAR